MSDTVPSLPTPEQILSALDRTGFVLEYRVAQRLQGLGFDVILNDAFTDPDTGKSREIDVVASVTKNIHRDNLAKIIIDATLIIECKNYTDPVVVIGRGNDTRFHNDNDKPVITFDPLSFEFANRSPKDYGGLYVRLGIWKLPSHSTKGFIGRQLIKMRRHDGRWQATNDSIYDSIIYPLAKATESERTEVANSASDDVPQPWYLPTFTYTFPILVTAGNIFTVDVIPGGAPVVAEAQWVPLVRHFSKSSFMMDVVSFNCLATYVQQRVFPRLKEANETLASHIEMFDPEWLKQQYGESSDPVFMEWLEDFRSSQARQADGEIDVPPSSC